MQLKKTCNFFNRLFVISVEVSNLVISVMKRVSVHNSPFKTQIIRARAIFHIKKF